jgi:amphi-Trp domain-containing protein
MDANALSMGFIQMVSEPFVTIKELEMGAEIVLFKSEQRSSQGEVAAFLRTLADKVESGQVILRQGSEELTLAIPQNLVLEIKAEEETSKRKSGKKMSLEVELEWQEGDEAGASGSVELG